MRKSILGFTLLLLLVLPGGSQQTGGGQGAGSAGTVTSITCGAGLTCTPNPIVNTGTIAASGGSSLAATQVGTPTTPTATVNGSAGTTTITYKVVGCEDTACTLHTPASAGVTPTTANATLSGSNFVNLKGYQISGAQIQCYNVYRTATNGTSPTTTGLIGTCVGIQFNDTGIAGDSTTPPSTDTTVLVATPLLTYSTMVGMSPALAPPATMNVMDDEFGETALTPQWTLINPAGSPTETFSGGQFVFSIPTTAGHPTEMIVQTAPAATYAFDLVLTNYRGVDASIPGGGGVNGSGGCQSQAQGGLAFRESATAKVEYVGFQCAAFGTTPKLEVGFYTNGTTFSADLAQETTFQFAFGPYCSRIKYDGTNVYFYMAAWTPLGCGGYFLIFSEAKAAHFTTAPDQVGILLDPGGNGATEYFDSFRRSQ